MDAFRSRPVRFLLLAGCFLLGCFGVACLQAATQPLTVSELCLMLRGGYTGEEILHETAGRPLLEPLDAAGERTLAQAGADARLINALKTNHAALSDAEAAAARQRQAEIDRRNLQAQQTSQAQAFAAPPQTAAPPTGSHHMADLLRGKLVALHDGQLRPCSDEALAGKKLFALYFSALWCGPCRKFTPQFVDFYKQAAQAHPELEVVFISDDHSAFDMENYMRQDGMPWAALAFERKAQEGELLRYAGAGIPDLVVVDGSGRILSNSYHGSEYVGPRKVLADLNKLLASPGGGSDL